MDEIRDAIRRAYIAGATDVHNNWQVDPDPCFAEAASDYADSIDLDALRTQENLTMEGEREDMGRPQAEVEPSSGCVFFDLNITCRKNACPICTSALVERYWPKPWTSTRPDGEEMVEVRDAHGRTILRLEWPFHGDEDASEAEQANYLLADRITALAVRPDNDELVERVARAAYAAHHHCGPTEEAYAEPNWGRGGFKTERLVWDAVARAAIAALREQGRSVRVEDLTEEEVEAIRNAKPREQGEG